MSFRIDTHATASTCDGCTAKSSARQRPEGSFPSRSRTTQSASAAFTAFKSTDWRWYANESWLPIAVIHHVLEPGGGEGTEEVGVGEDKGQVLSRESPDPWVVDDVHPDRPQLVRNPKRSVGRQTRSAAVKTAMAARAWSAAGWTDQGGSGRASPPPGAPFGGRRGLLRVMEWSSGAPVSRRRLSRSSPTRWSQSLSETFRTPRP